MQSASFHRYHHHLFFSPFPPPCPPPPPSAPGGERGGNSLLTLSCTQEMKRGEKKQTHQQGRIWALTKDDADGGVRGFCSSLSSPSRLGARLLFGISLGGGEEGMLVCFVCIFLAAKERERWDWGRGGRGIPFFAIIVSVEWYKRCRGLAWDFISLTNHIMCVVSH